MSAEAPRPPALAGFLELRGRDVVRMFRRDFLRGGKMRQDPARTES